MKNSTTIGLVIALSLIISACSNNTQKEEFQDFEFEKDFEINKTLFSKDTFTINGHSTEGGEILVFQSKKRDYKVYDVWLYNEMSKRNTIYYVDKSSKVKLVKQATYIYDKPIYLEGATAKELVHYFTYHKDNFKYFSNLKLEVTDGNLKIKKRKELEQLFNTTLQSTNNSLVKKNNENI
ncbi:MAG: hypothetical protein QM499_12105 [Flavobacteriaceae bacterium]